MADNNKTTQAPFGDGQIWEFAGITLTLDNCNFNPNGDSGPMGYIRSQNQSTLARINQYTVFGSSPIRSPLFTEKFAFQWSLIMDQTEWATFEAIVRAQQFNIQTRQSVENIGVRVKDARKVLIEPEPRTRARMSADPIPGLGVPAGFEAFYPQFDVMLSVNENQVTWLMDKSPSETLLLVEVIGLELDIVPTSDDSDDEIIPPTP